MSTLEDTKLVATATTAPDTTPDVNAPEAPPLIDATGPKAPLGSFVFGVSALGNIEKEGV